jgi:hypothetical protein
LFANGHANSGESLFYRSGESLFYRSGVKMDCPLPIDWLDYLEEREVDVSVDLRAHLDECRRCQLLVEELRQQSVGVELNAYQGTALESLPRWREEERAEIAVGDIWLTGDAFANAYVGLRRQLVLVVAEREEFNKRWISVAPLTTETETATNTDLLLNGDDTSLGVPLAVEFRAQTPLLEEQLASYLGAATESGRELLAGAVAGTVERGSFGAAIANPLDRRLRRIEETRRLMATLASVYGDSLNQAEASAEKEAALEATADATSAGDSWGGLTLVETLEQGKWQATPESAVEHAVLAVLIPVKPAVQEGVLALAAGTVEWSNPLVNHFAFESPRCALRARLELTGMRGDEVLRLFIEVVSGFSSAPVLISFAKPSGERVESPPFPPTPGAEVVVARGPVGISPADVDRLELRRS